MKRNDNLWDNLRQGFKEGLQFTVQKTEELTRIGKLRLDIAAARRRMDKAAAELGMLVHEQMHDSTSITLYIDVTMQDALQTLRSQETQLHKLEDQLEMATRRRNGEDEEEDLAEATVLDEDDLVDEEDEFGQEPDPRDKAGKPDDESEGSTRDSGRPLL